MINRLINIYERYKEIILYIIFGVLTTIVNFLIYFLFTNLLHVNYLISNFTAWIGAVIFAFFTNKKYVFNANNTKLLNYIKEFIMFTSSRGFSFLVETFLLFLGVELIKLNDGIVKVAVAVIVVILNYFFTKFVFKNRDGKEDKEEKNKSFKNKEVWYKRWYVIYTGLFIITALLFLLPFIKNGVSFIWDRYAMNGGDGFTQHFPSAIYFGNYFKEIILNLFTNHELIVPMWDLKIGTGYDIFTTLNYYAFGDILNIFYIFTPEKMSAYVYSSLVILRLYLSGLFFSMFCFKFNQKKIPVLIGALSYAFCGYALTAALKHPFFVNSMIYLPLLLMGIENIFRGKKPYLFIIMVTVSFINNFYFFYMLTIAVVCYAFIRVMYLYKDKKIFLRKFIEYLFKFAVYYIIGILLSLFIMLPVILAFINSSRASGQRESLSLFYNLGYYLNYIKNIFTANNVSSWMFLGFNIVTVMSVFAIFKDKSKAGKYLRNITLIILILSFLPVFGYIMNGFSYISNRWCFIFAFIVCFVFVYILGDFKAFLVNKKKYIYVCLFVLLFINIALDRFFVYFGKNNSYFIYNYISILSGIILFFIISRKSIRIRTVYLLMCLLVIIQITGSGYMKNSVYTGNFISQFKKYNNVSKEMNLKEYEFIKDYDKGIYRIDKTNERMNYGMLNNVNGISAFYSIRNKNTLDYIFKTGLLENITYSSNHGYDYHIVSNELKGVKYFISDKNYEMHKNYKPVKNYDEKTIYKNNNSLGLFYTYDSVMNDDKFNKLNENDREFAMLQSVYLEDESFIKPRKVMPSSKTILNFNGILENSKYDKEKIDIEKGKITVKEEDSSIILNLGDVSNSECYLYMKDFYADLQRKIKDNATLKDKIKFELSLSPEVTYLRFYSNYKKSNAHKAIIISKGNVYYIGENNYVFNLGYYKDAKNLKVKVTFGKKGVYNFSDMKVLCQPMNKLNRYINKLKEDKVENFNIKANTISLNVKTNKNKIGVLSIPYSPGWKAYVNGREVEVLRANVDSMGIELKKGNNKVVFKYCTPGLKEGSLISLVTALGCIIFIITGKKRKKALL